MGEENDLEKSMIFSGMVSVSAFQPSVIAEPIPGVKLYDGLCLNEFGPELTWMSGDGLYNPQTGPTCTTQSGTTKVTINTEKE